MAGYTSRWTCRICGTAAESIDGPGVEVCDECVRPLAEKLCRDALGHGLGTLGVDSRYWYARAYVYVGLLFKRASVRKEAA